MDRKRRGPDGAERREARQDSGPPRRAPSVVDAILDLQATAGNRAVTAALDPTTVQREPAPTAKNDGGALTLDSGEEIPLQSATWSLRVGVKAVYVGHERFPQIEPTMREIGDLVLTRAPDAKSRGMPELLSTEHERGSLRLDRPSREGALPATTLALRRPTLVEYQAGRGEDPTETLRIAVGDLRVAGMGKEAPTAKAVAFLQVGGGEDAWAPIPVISWDRQGHATPPVAEPVPGTLKSKRLAEERPAELIVTIAAGMGMTRLAEALDQKRRLDVTLSPRGAGKKIELQNAIVMGVASTGGPSVVEVRFAPERAR